MVATRAQIHSLIAEESEVTLRATVRDLVALSSLPAIWIRADPPQVAQGLAQLVVSMLDADFACVALEEHDVNILECHNRTGSTDRYDSSTLAAALIPHAASTVDVPPFGPLHRFSVPVGREAGSYLTAVSRIAGFPDETQRTLMRVAAQQAGVALQRWKTEQSLLQQKQSLEALNRTSTALYSYTDRLYRAHSIQEVYDAALDAIVEALGCRRASILRCDEMGIMRFVAWRGLSEKYRAAVEGHTPWTAGDSDPQPICLSDIEAANLGDSLRATVAEEGIRALAFIPLVSNGAVIGKFMTYYDLTHPFERGEVDLAVTIARQLGFSLERHHTEQQVRRLNDTLERRVEERTAERDRVWRNSRDLLVIIGADGMFRGANPAWAEILGYSPEEIVGHSFLDFVLAEDANRTSGGLQKAMSGDDLTAFENRYRHKDGTLRWLSWHTSLEGDLVYAYGRDITAAKAQTAALAEAETALRQAQKMEAIGQLTGGIAHDFNNLLQGVAGSLDLIRRKAEDPQRVRNWADAGLQVAQRGAKLTAQLLAFSRSQKLELKSLNLSRLLSDMRELLGRTLGPSVRIVLDLDPDASTVLGDETQLETAVLNLAINARDAMPQGGELLISTRRRCVTRDPELSSGDYIELAVADTGLGMPPDVLAKAFDPFFTTKGVGKGTGLGLSQVYGMTKQAGGIARIDSSPRGTTVRLFLQTTEDAAAHEPSLETEPHALPAVAATVLVIDDDPDVRKFLTDSLELLGYGVLQAEDGYAGLAALARSSPDLLIIDFAMPGLTGAEVGREARGQRSDLPIVFASGYADTAAIENVLDSNTAVLRKPFRVDELQEAVSRLLSA